jgi:hypothetical protein
MVVELEGGITSGFDKFALFVTVTDKYVLVLFRKTQYEPTVDPAVVVGSVMELNPEFVM